MTNTTDILNENQLERAAASQWCLITQWSAITLKGENLNQFLQGQVTCNLTRLSDTQALWGAHCNVKGRAIANFIITLWNDQTLILAPKTSLPLLSDSLKKYGIFNRLVIDSPEVALAFHQETLHEQPTAQLPFQAIGTDQHLTIHLAPGLKMQLADNLQALESSNNSAQRQSESLWTLAQINLNLPFIDGSQSGQFIPNELNMDILEGIAFDKGCYIGQEIIARLHYKSQPKQRIFQLELPKASPILDTDSKLFSQSKAIGSIICINQTESGEGKALAMIKTAEIQLDSENEFYLAKKDQNVPEPKKINAKVNKVVKKDQG